ncbi:flippase [Candidatus Uhrbacteria bacterium]|nr:flippase [Candidatus Uhrbacteria bacterium]
MSLSQRIAANTILQITAKVLSTVLAAVTLGILTRYLHQEGFGAFTIATTFPQIFGIVADLGFSLIGIQLISEARENHARNYHAIITLRLITAVIFLIIAPIASLLFPYPLEVKIGIAIISISVLLSSLIQIFTIQFQVNLAMLMPMIADIVSKVFLIAGIGIAISVQASFVAILWLFVLNNSIQFAIVVIGSIRYERIALIWDPPLFRSIIARSWPIGLSIVFNLIYLKLDTIILSLYHSQSDVGIYGGAYRVFEVLISLPSMFMGIVLASFARSWSNGDSASFKRYFQKSFDFMIMATLPLIAGTFFMARPLMVAVLGEPFERSGDVLLILILGTGCVFFGSFIGHLINVIHQQRRMLFGYLIGAGIGIVGYVILIPPFTYWGAAWATVVTECVVLCIAFFVFTKATGVRPNFDAAKRIGVATAIMAFSLVFLSRIPLLAAVSGATILYGSALYLFGVIPKDLVTDLFRVTRRATDPSQKAA